MVPRTKPRTMGVGPLAAQPAEGECSLQKDAGEPTVGFSLSYGQAGSVGNTDLSGTARVHWRTVAPGVGI